MKSEIEESLIKERLRKVAMNQREIIDQVEVMDVTLFLLLTVIDASEEGDPVDYALCTQRTC